MFSSVLQLFLTNLKRRVNYHFSFIKRGKLQHLRILGKGTPLHYTAKCLVTVYSSRPNQVKI